MSLNFELSEEQMLIRETARKLMEDLIVPNRDVYFKTALRDKDFRDDIWRAICDAGFMGAMIPEEYGGSGMGLLAFLIAVEEMSAAGFFNEFFVITTMDTMCVLKGGSEDVKKRFLPGIANGSLKFCFGLTEVEAGSNTFNIATRAKRDGDAYLLNGSKTFISGADCADYILVISRTTPVKELKERGLRKTHGMSLFLVPTDAEGLSMDQLPISTMPAARQFTIFFDDVRVPADNIVGEEDQGAVVLFKALNPERLVFAASIVGISQYCLDLACDYARDRRVFRDTPIGAHQAIQHPLAEIKILQEALRICVYRAGKDFDDDKSPLEVGYHTNVAFYLASQLGSRAVDVAMQTLGGNGFSDDYGLPQLMMYSRLLKTAPISREMVLNYVGEHVLGLPRSY